MLSNRCRFRALGEDACIGGGLALHVSDSWLEGSMTKGWQSGTCGAAARARPTEMTEAFGLRHCNFIWTVRVSLCILETERPSPPDDLSQLFVERRSRQVALVDSIRQGSRARD